MTCQTFAVKAVQFLFFCPYLNLHIVQGYKHSWHVNLICYKAVQENLKCSHLKITETRNLRPLAKQLLVQLPVQECYHPNVDVSRLFIMLKNI
jgi:hypothetical protein